MLIMNIVLVIDDNEPKLKVWANLVPKLKIEISNSRTSWTY